MLTTHNSSFPSIHQNSTLISLTCTMLYNRSLPGWLQTFLLSTLLKLSFFLSDLNTTLLSLQPTLLTTLALSLMNNLPSPTKSLHFLNLLSYHIRELRCIGPYLDFTTANTIATSVVHSKLDYCNSITTFQTINLTGSNRSRTLLLVLLLSSSSIGACRWRCCSCESPPSCSVLSSPMPWREAKIKLAQIFLHRS